MSKVLFMLPKLHGEFRSLCLEVIQSRADRVENVFSEMKSKNLLSMLTHRCSNILPVMCNVTHGDLHVHVRHDFLSQR